MIWLPERTIFPEKQIRVADPEKLLPLVSLYGFIMNLTRIRQRIVATSSTIIRSTGYMLVANMWANLAHSILFVFSILVQN